MFKIIAVAVIVILVGIGFFDIGQEAYTLAALLLGICALLDYSQRRAAAKGEEQGVPHASPYTLPNGLTPASLSKIISRKGKR